MPGLENRIVREYIPPFVPILWRYIRREKTKRWVAMHINCQLSIGPDTHLQLVPMPRSRMVELYLHSLYVFMVWCLINYWEYFTYLTFNVNPGSNSTYIPTFIYLRLRNFSKNYPPVLYACVHVFSCIYLFLIYFKNAFNSGQIASNGRMDAE
jgi:hypothetical protein